MKVNCLTHKGEKEAINRRGLLNMTLLMTGKLSQTHKREGKDFFRVSVACFSSHLN